MKSPMKQTPRKLQALLLAGLLTTLAGCGVAQSAPPRAESAQGHSTMQHAGHARMQERMSQRMAELKSQLNITPAQETAWSAFTAAMQHMPSPAYAGMRANHEALSKLPTPERLDRMRALHTEHMTEMNARMNQRADATKTFYNVLSPAQKKTFDDALTRSMNSRHGSHMMGGAKGMGQGADGHQKDRHADHHS